MKECRGWTDLCRHAGGQGEKKKKKEPTLAQCYLSSSDGHLGLLIYRLVTETAYQQQPHPSAHAHSEGLIWIFEGGKEKKKRAHTHTHPAHQKCTQRHTHVHTHAHIKHPTNPGLSLHSIVWLRLLSPGVTASRWLALSCQSQPGAHTQARAHAQTRTNTRKLHTQAHTKALAHNRESAPLHAQHMHSVG